MNSNVFSFFLKIVCNHHSCICTRNQKCRHEALSKYKVRQLQRSLEDSFCNKQQVCLVSLMWPCCHHAEISWTTAVGRQERVFSETGAAVSKAFSFWTIYSLHGLLQMNRGTGAIAKYPYIHFKYSRMACWPNTQSGMREGCCWINGDKYLQ